jgi:hypothetical protein
MADDPIRSTDMVDITDCFEAVSVFRAWRNVFFFVAVACLLLLQGVFWMVDVGWVQLPPQAGEARVDTMKDGATGQAAQPADGNAAGSTPRLHAGKDGILGIVLEHAVRLIRVANGVLLLAAALYWLTQLFTLLLSVVGRLGGINHVCRAFFLSLVVLVLLIPWQHFIDSTVVGATFSAGDLARGLVTQALGTYEKGVYYLRFSGYPLAVLVVLVLAHLRSMRWAKAILRRLEII